MVLYGPIGGGMTGQPALDVRSYVLLAFQVTYPIIPLQLRKPKRNLILANASQNQDQKDTKSHGVL